MCLCACVYVCAPQELLSRTSLETEKLDLVDEVSSLKLKLVGMEDPPSEGDSKQHKAEVRSRGGAWDSYFGCCVWAHTQKASPSTGGEPHLPLDRVNRHQEEREHVLFSGLEGRARLKVSV